MNLFKSRAGRNVPFSIFRFSTKGKNPYDEALQRFKEADNRRQFKQKFFKYFYYSLAASFVGFYSFYIAKASGLFANLNIGQRYKERQKLQREKHMINQEQIDKKIREFDEKYEINKKLEMKEDKLKYGNKELNMRIEEALSDPSTNSHSNNGEDDATEQIKSIDILQTEKMKSSEKTLYREYNVNGENIVYSKEGNFEQLKIHQGAEENPDPRIMGNTIIFDSRFDSIGKGKI